MEHGKGTAEEEKNKIGGLCVRSLRSMLESLWVRTLKDSSTLGSYNYKVPSYLRVTVFG